MTSTHGLPVWAAARSPNSSGTGPYGVIVSIQRWSTAWTIGPCKDAGPCSYGDSPRWVSMPWAA